MNKESIVLITKEAKGKEPKAHQGSTGSLGSCSGMSKTKRGIQESWKGAYTFFNYEAQNIILE